MNPVGFFIGLAFDFVIVAARLNEDTVIRDILLRRDPEPYLVLGSGVLVAAPLLQWLRARRWLAPVAREVVAFQPQPIRRDHVFGGVVFGTGWAIACTCPVPAVGMVATGKMLPGDRWRNAHRAAIRAEVARLEPDVVLLDGGDGRDTRMTIKRRDVSVSFISAASRFGVLTSRASGAPSGISLAWPRVRVLAESTEICATLTRNVSLCASRTSMEQSPRQRGSDSRAEGCVARGCDRLSDDHRS